jgi:Right handed beta helix region
MYRNSCSENTFAIMRRIVTWLVGVILCIAAHPAAAANWYVDNAVLISGNGASWPTAWKSFSTISWSLIKPGDTVYISGGYSGQTYYETLTIGASGSSEGKITITSGTDAGHNSAVIIDGGNSRQGVYSYGHSYLDIKNLSVRNVSGAGFVVRNAAGAIIENNGVYSGPGPANGDARGYDVRNSSDVIVHNNAFNTPVSTTAQTDGIFSSGNDGVIFEGNSLVVSNSDPTGHSDGIQSYRDVNITIRNNYISHPYGGTNNHGMWLSDASGTITVYNNIVYMPVGDEQAITYWNETGYAGRAQLWNNTVYGAYWCYRFIAAPNSELKNNICWPTSGSTGVMIESGALSAANVDYNLDWAPNATIGNVNGSAKNWSQWQAFGYDVHGVNANPQFVTVNPTGAPQEFDLLPASPAIDGGTALSTVTDDYMGTQRPQGNDYDIGAYEWPG